MLFVLLLLWVWYCVYALTLTSSKCAIKHLKPIQGTIQGTIQGALQEALQASVARSGSVLFTHRNKFVTILLTIRPWCKWRRRWRGRGWQGWAPGRWRGSCPRCRGWSYTGTGCGAVIMPSEVMRYETELTDHNEPVLRPLGHGGAAQVPGQPRWAGLAVLCYLVTIRGAAPPPPGTCHVSQCVKGHLTHGYLYSPPTTFPCLSRGSLDSKRRPHLSSQSTFKNTKLGWGIFKSQRVCKLCFFSRIVVFS